VTSANRGIKIVALLVVVSALAAVQLFLREPDSTLLWAELFNSGHAPLYGLLALVVLAILDTMRPTWQRGRRYMQAFWITFIAGTAMEALQRLGPRNPQIADVLRNGAGIVAFLAVAASFDRGLLHETSRNRALKKAALWLGAAVALCLAFLPVILAGGAVVARDRAFPQLCGFDTVWERRHVIVNENAEVEFTQPPAVWNRDRDGFVAHVTFSPGRFSVLRLVDPFPDWTGYESLTFDAYSQLEAPVAVTLWVVDAQHLAGDWGSFRRKLTIEPGVNRFEIPLSEIRTEPRERELDITRIRKVAIYGSRVESPFSLFLGELRLD
jgi:hypothetical protein